MLSEGYGKKIFGFLVVVCLSIPGTAFAESTTRVSLTSAGNQVYGQSGWSSISGDGNYIVVNGSAWQTPMVHDRLTGEAIRIFSYDGGTINAYTDGRISNDGRYLLLQSSATNIVPNDLNGSNDVFVYDLTAASAELVSASSTGAQGNSGTWMVGISGDGQRVLFVSGATNLVPQNVSGWRMYLRDRTTGTTSLIDLGFDPGYTFIQQLQSWQLSNDGNFISFNGYGPDGVMGVFIHDLTTGTTEKCNVTSAGAPLDGYSLRSAISAGGEYVAFSMRVGDQFDPTNKRKPFVRNRLTSSTEELTISPALGLDGGNYDIVGLSTDGRFVLINSNENPNYPFAQVLLYDRQDGESEVISLDDSGSYGNDHSFLYPGMVSNDGRFVTFTSYATNLVADDTNATMDVFLRDRVVDNDGDGFSADVDCNDYDATVYPGAPEIKHDGIDQDCNGYDLTIDISVADYDTLNSLLTVKATSDLGTAADLQVLGLGPMSWRDKKQEWMLDFTGANPGSVTVIGPEGAETATVNAQ